MVSTNFFTSELTVSDVCVCGAVCVCLCVLVKRKILQVMIFHPSSHLNESMSHCGALHAPRLIFESYRLGQKHMVQSVGAWIQLVVIVIIE